MISVMNNNDFELDQTTGIIEDEAQSEGRVSGDSSVVSSDNVVNGDENRVSGNDVVDNSVTDTHRGIDEDKSVNFVGYEEIGVSSELENRASESGVDGRFSVGGFNNLENSGSEKTRVSEVDCSGDSDTRNKDVTQRTNDLKVSARHSGPEQWGSKVEKVGVNSAEKGLVKVTHRASEYESMISMFDEFAGNGKGRALGAGLSTSVGYGYEIGDMVWGKVKSHPWWPGHIYNEAFASPSVRRTKRAGDVLVAFFGDSSYGWFDPAELLPFDPYFSEKSRQTNSRNFVKAVEEAVDEASRRCGLGLACRCRNPYNFRPTNVQGYFAVDVDDYEPGGFYSANQIRKARDSFDPKSTLDFVKQLALMPLGDGHGSIDFIKNKATVLAHRKAVFEEFDETYAQAFGQQPVRPTREPVDPTAQPARAPLSGPLVIAEALGKRKNFTKPNKLKDQAKKDRYLFKRRDEPNELKTQQIGQSTSSIQPSAYVEGSMELAAGDYVLQKRAPSVSTKQQIPTKLEQMLMDGASASSRDATGEEVVTVEDKTAATRFSMAVSLTNGSKVEPSTSFTDSFPVRQAPVYTGHLLEPKSSSDGKGALLEAKEPTGYNAIAYPPIMDASGLSGKGAFRGGIEDLHHTLEEQGEVTMNAKHDRQSAATTAVAEEVHGQEQIHSSGGGHVLPAIDAKFHGQDSRIHIDTGAKKAKLPKRPFGDLVAEKSAPGEKKKKRKKELGIAMSSDNKQRRPVAEKGGASVGRTAVKLVHVGQPEREEFQVENHQKKGDGVSSSLLSDSLGKRPMVGMESSEHNLPQLLGDLQALALNPFHGLERNSPAVIRQAFLKFRSLVYQKSLALSISSEMESDEVHAPKSPAGSTTGSDKPPRENIKDLPSSKPPKPLVRHDDPTKGGRKRGPSDRQEGMAAKRLKKINDMKSLAVEKKAPQKTLEVQRDGKETVAPRPLKLLKPDSVKKIESQAKAPEPTTLVLKFPPMTNLPSGSELKARLARFGPLDHSLTRVFWQTSTCRVVFMYRVDAEAAHRHLTGHNTLFGNVNVRCYIRPLVGATPPESESKVVQREDAPAPMETLQLRGDSAVEQRPPAQQPLQQPGVQLKSCLKKPMGDEAAAVGGNNGGGSRGTPRVRFMLGGSGGGESSSGGEQLNKNNYNNASFADGGGASSSSSHGMDFISKNFQKVIPPPPMPTLPLPVTSHFPNAPNNLRYAEAAPPHRNTHNFNTNMAQPAAAAASNNVDIAQQMISLLIKCNDVVTNVNRTLGYVPYHPL